MANFVEQATLLLKDQSSPQIRKVNNELKKLFATVNRLKSKTIDLKVNTSGLAKARRDMEAMAKLSRGKGLAASLGNVSTAGISRYLGIVKQIEASAKATQRALSSARQPRGNGLQPPPSNRSGRGRFRTGAGIGIPGIGGVGVSGNGFGIGTLAVSLGTLTITAKSVIVQGALREAGQQQLAAQSTQAQEAALKMVSAPAGVPINDLSFQNLAAGFLADTSGSVKAATTLAQRTIQSAQDLARNRGISFDQALEEVGNSLVKAVGQVTTDMVDSSGNLTKRAKESFDTIDKVLSVQPTLKPGDVSTTTAGLGPQRTTIDQGTLFNSLFLAGDFGTKIGNQIRQGMLTAGGNQQAKSNKAMARLGIDQNDTRIQTDFNGWLVDTLLPKIDAKVDADFKKRDVTPTTEERNAARGKVIQEVIGRQTGQNAINELLVSQNQLIRAREQAEKQFAETASERATAAMSWTNQLAISGTKAAEILGKLGDTLGGTLVPAIDTLNTGLASINKFITNPNGEVDPAKAAAVGGGALAAGAIGGKLLLNFLNPLNGSAVALNGSAAALTEAAVALGGAGALGKGAAAGGAWAAVRGFFARAMLATGAAGGAALALSPQDQASNANVIETLSNNVKAWTEQLKQLQAQGAPKQQIDAMAARIAREQASIERIKADGQKTVQQAVVEGLKAAPMKAGQLPDQIANLKLTAQNIQVDAATAEMGRMMKLEASDKAKGLALGQVPDNIGATFDNLSPKVQAAIGAGGQDAVAALQGGAPQVGTSIGTSAAAAINGNSIGAQIGSTAAAIIAQAVANANVNVNVRQPTPANTGVQAPVE